MEVDWTWIAFDFGFQETDAFARDDTVAFFVHLLEIWMPLSHCCD